MLVSRLSSSLILAIPIVVAAFNSFDGSLDDENLDGEVWNVGDDVEIGWSTNITVNNLTLWDTNTLTNARFVDILFEVSPSISPFKYCVPPTVENCAVNTFRLWAYRDNNELCRSAQIIIRSNHSIQSTISPSETLSTSSTVSTSSSLTTTTPPSQPTRKPPSHTGITYVTDSDSDALDMFLGDDRSHDITLSLGLGLGLGVPLLAVLIIGAVIYGKRRHRARMVFGERRKGGPPFTADMRIDPVRMVNYGAPSELG